MLLNLEKIGSVISGIYKKGSPTGDTYYLQAKHFDEHGKFRKDIIISPEVAMDDRLERHILQDKDLLITAKGENNRVCLYQSRIGQSVASSTFFVIRLHEPNILPEFLQWYFNTSKMQGLFSSLSRGTHILSLSKKALLKVKIEIPTLEQQHEVLKLQSLWETGAKYHFRITKTKKDYFINTSTIKSGNIKTD
jgi:restriction endonuclease S subunit